MNEEIIENLNKRLDEAVDRGRQMVEEEELADRVDELKIRAEKLIREHPLKCVGGGLLAGYILGKIFSPKDE